MKASHLKWKQRAPPPLALVSQRALGSQIWAPRPRVSPGSRGGFRGLRRSRGPDRPRGPWPQAPEREGDGKAPAAQQTGEAASCLRGPPESGAESEAASEPELTVEASPARGVHAGGSLTAGGDTPASPPPGRHRLPPPSSRPASGSRHRPSRGRRAKWRPSGRLARWRQRRGRQRAKLPGPRPQKLPPRPPLIAGRCAVLALGAQPGRATACSGLPTTTGEGGREEEESGRH